MKTTQSLKERDPIMPSQFNEMAITARPMRLSRSHLCLAAVPSAVRARRPHAIFPPASEDRPGFKKIVAELAKLWRPPPRRLSRARTSRRRSQKQQSSSKEACMGGELPPVSMPKTFADAQLDQGEDARQICLPTKGSAIDEDGSGTITREERTTCSSSISNRWRAPRWCQLFSS